LIRITPLGARNFSIETQGEVTALRKGSSRTVDRRGVREGAVLDTGDSIPGVVLNGSAAPPLH
jgi:hypothetical protein